MRNIFKPLLSIIKPFSNSRISRDSNIKNSNYKKNIGNLTSSNDNSRINITSLNVTNPIINRKPNHSTQIPLVYNSNSAKPTLDIPNNFLTSSRLLNKKNILPLLHVQPTEVKQGSSKIAQAARERYTNPIREKQILSVPNQLKYMTSILNTNNIEYKRGSSTKSQAARERYKPELEQLKQEFKQRNSVVQRNKTKSLESNIGSDDLLKIKISKTLLNTTSNVENSPTYSVSNQALIKTSVNTKTLLDSAEFPNLRENIRDSFYRTHTNPTNMLRQVKDRNWQQIIDTKPLTLMGNPSSQSINMMWINHEYDNDKNSNKNITHDKLRRYLNHGTLEDKQNLSFEDIQILMAYQELKRLNTSDEEIARALNNMNFECDETTLTYLANIYKIDNNKKINNQPEF